MLAALGMLQHRGRQALARTGRSQATPFLSHPTCAAHREPSTLCSCSSLPSTSAPSCSRPREAGRTRVATRTLAAAAALNANTDPEAVQIESLEVLEWPSVCRQVAHFAQTVIAVQLIAGGKVPIGRSIEESQLLLQQTAEAMDAALK